ncbi:hypothetical protein PIB30_069072 [Stylosanthes scabra]|uniref:Uncharacterized protein n=1 Tax=Stylosanthes scabra TaxID=79078 RepID=A0ABU6VN32_9FABA|nr:hypothetical protein [Stylosanthes scabra]
MVLSTNGEINEDPCEPRTVAKPIELALRRWGLVPNHPSFFISEEGRKGVRERAKVAWSGDGGDHYSPTASGGHNFRSGTPIDAPFAPTRSLFYPLQLYTNMKPMSLQLRPQLMMYVQVVQVARIELSDGVLGYSMVRRKSRVSIELGVQQFCKSAAELQGIDSTCNRVDSLSYFLRKIGFREQRIDSHDLRIDSENHRGQLIVICIDSSPSKLQRIDSAEARVDSTSEIGLKGGPRFISTENPWAGDSHYVYFRLFRCRFKLGKWRSVVWSRLSGGLSSFRCLVSKWFWKSLVYESVSSVCSATVSAECVRGVVSHIGVLQFLVSEQFFPCEPEEWNCYASEHILNQRIMRKMLPKAII